MSQSFESNNTETKSYFSKQFFISRLTIMKRTITTPYCLQRPLELNDLFATAASLLSAGNNKDIGRCLKVRRSSGEGRD